MRKLSLQVEALEVESFATAAPVAQRGTAFAHDGRHDHAPPPDPDQHVLGWPEKPTPQQTGYPNETCYGTCYFSCGCSLPC